MSKVLHLTLKKKWFDMIASGQKKEEYREIKQHWASRLIDLFPHDRFPRTDAMEYQDIVFDLKHGHKLDDVMKSYRAGLKNFDAICFRNGYAKNAPTITVEFKGIDIGPAKPEWSDNWQGEVFRIKLGNIINPLTSL